VNHAEGRTGGQRLLGKSGAIVATLLAIGLAYAVARNAVSDIPPAAAFLPPVSQAQKMRLLATAAQNPKFYVSEHMAKSVEAALMAKPLSSEPFFLAAKAEEKAGRVNRAILLLEEARRRRPTNVATRLQLMVYYGQTRRFEAFLSEMNVVLQRSSEARSYILPELSKFLSDASAREALSPVLAAMPDWRAEFFAAAAKRGVRPEDAQALLSLARRKGQKDVELEFKLYLQSLITAGENRKARALWVAALPARARGLASSIFDGSFVGSTIAEPFGWVLHDSEVGRAETSVADGSPHLDVSYFGGKNSVLAEQNLARPAGRHLLSYAVRSEDGIKSGDLSWQVICLPNRTLAAKLSFGKPGPTYSRRQIALFIPPDCEGQLLALVAEPGDVSAAVNAQVTRLAISEGDEGGGDANQQLPPRQEAHDSDR
jgi:hypothetical protein